MGLILFGGYGTVCIAVSAKEEFEGVEAAPKLAPSKKILET